MIAALPMYFAPLDAVQAFWSAVAALLRQQVDGDIPQALTWPDDYHAHWLQPDLLLSQTCGYPLTTSLQGKVQLVGTFAYDVPQAQGIECQSVLICRSPDSRQTLADFAGCTLAFNGTDSQSGYNALRALLAQSGATPPFFGRSISTGSHGKSIAAVHTGQADMAAIDCVTWALWQRSNPALVADLRVFAHTDSYPGLPLVSALATPAATLQALQQALRTVACDAAFAALRAPLLIKGFAVTTLTQYQRCTQMQALALERGWTAL